MLKLRHFRLVKLIACIACIAPLACSAIDLDIPYSLFLPQDASEKADAAPTTPPSQSNIQVVLIEEVDMWERIRKGFIIENTSNPLIAQQTLFYGERPDYFKRTATRASRYLFHVVSELDKRGMPTELALLPFIESSFNPEAYSTAKASGLWQFIPSTGLVYKLKQTVFKDERRDIVASTNAALNYLEKLYGMFGDWQLALAAYNWGEGAVQRAIKKNIALGKPTDFNSLAPLMPAETRNYVPKLLAVKNIIADPAKYGITLPKLDNQPYFVTIKKTQDIDIKIAAQLAEMSVEEFKSLNPQFNRPIIIGSDKTQILLPHDNAEKFQTNLAKWNRPLSSWTSLTIHKREHVENIAKMFRILPESLREVNRIPPKMLLKPGSTILVPKTANVAYADIAPEIVDNATLATEPETPPTKRITVKVGKKDNLASIARRYKVSTTQIKEWNKLAHDKLVTGQKLRIEVANENRAKAKAKVKAKANVKANVKAKVSAKAGKTKRARANTTQKKRHH